MFSTELVYVAKNFANIIRRSPRGRRVYHADGGVGQHRGAGHHGRRARGGVRRHQVPGVPEGPVRSGRDPARRRQLCCVQ